MADRPGTPAPVPPRSETDLALSRSANAADRTRALNGLCVREAGPGAWARVLEMAEGDPDPEVREEAVYALGEILLGAVRDRDPVADSWRTRLFGFLDDARESQGLRAAALQALGRGGPSRELWTRVREALGADDPAWRSAAAHVLGNQTWPVRKKLFDRLFTDPDPWVRRTGVLAAARRGLRRAAEPLREWILTGPEERLNRALGVAYSAMPIGAAVALCFAVGARGFPSVLEYRRTEDRIPPGSGHFWERLGEAKLRTGRSPTLEWGATLRRAIRTRCAAFDAGPETTAVAETVGWLFVAETLLRSRGKLPAGPLSADEALEFLKDLEDWGGAWHPRLQQEGNTGTCVAFQALHESGHFPFPAVFPGLRGDDDEDE
ncbi:MAG: hypothetical protein L0216_16290 [Planctomycetales bacterium]|nr:hypothetical protein [Planctomycetales bacterium]